MRVTCRVVTLSMTEVLLSPLTVWSKSVYWLLINKFLLQCQGKGGGKSIKYEVWTVFFYKDDLDNTCNDIAFPYLVALSNEKKSSSGISSKYCTTCCFFINRERQYLATIQWIFTCEKSVNTHRIQPSTTKATTIVFSV